MLSISAGDHMLRLQASSCSLWLPETICHNDTHNDTHILAYCVSKCPSMHICCDRHACKPRVHSRAHPGASSVTWFNGRGSQAYGEALCQVQYACKHTQTQTMWCAATTLNTYCSNICITQHTYIIHPHQFQLCLHDACAYPVVEHTR